MRSRNMRLPRPCVSATSQNPPDSQISFALIHWWRTMEVRHGYSSSVARGLQGFAAARGLARKTKDGPQARRLLAVAAIYDGATRTEAAKIGGVGLQIIRDWVMRFNARGGLQVCSTANRRVNPRSSMMCNARRLCG